MHTPPPIQGEMPPDRRESRYPKAEAKSVTETSTWMVVNDVCKDSLPETHQNGELFFDF